METVKAKCIENCYDCQVQGVNKTACGVARLVGKVSCLSDNVNTLAVIVNNQTELINSLSVNLDEALSKLDLLLATPDNPEEEKKKPKTKE